MRQSNALQRALDCEASGHEGAVVYVDEAFCVNGQEGCVNIVTIDRGEVVERTHKKVKNCRKGENMSS